MPERSMSPKERRVIEAMVDGGLLYVYVEAKDGTFRDEWPRPGTGAIVYDGPPMWVGAGLVRRIRRLGACWNNALRAEVLTDDGLIRARAVLHGRDVILVASPGRAPADA